LSSFDFLEKVWLIWRRAALKLYVQMSKQISILKKNKINKKNIKNGMTLANAQYDRMYSSYI
jgi:hypothetical protein